MKRDELIKLLTENFTADEEVTFLVNDSEYGVIKETEAKVKEYEETYYKGHWELSYNGKTYTSTSKLGLLSQAKDYPNYPDKLFNLDDVKFVNDTGDIHEVTKVLAIG